MPTVLVNADDFGLHRDIDRGILDCIEKGVVQSLSFCPQGQSLDWQVLRDLHDRGVRVGLHVTLVGEPWITDGRVIPGWKQLVKQLATPKEPGEQMRLDISRELTAQVRRCVDEQITLAHIDSHQHIHVFPGVWQPVLAAAQRHNIPRVRVPWCPSWMTIKRSVGGVALQLLSARFGKHLNRFLPILGVAHAGRNTLEIYDREFSYTNGQDVELCVHPGHATPPLLKKYADWDFDWRSERDALLDPQFPEMLARHGYSFAHTAQQVATSAA